MTPIQYFTRPLGDVSLPMEAGAYALLIRLRGRLRARIGVLGEIDLPAGDYLYLGSAYGSGGLRARLRRHLRAGKSFHWHVDRLTSTGDVTGILAVPGGRECDLVDRALRCDGTSVPITGFGSTDCRRCPAHLLAVPETTEAVFTALAA